jgi:hypothetical protein
LTGLARLRLYGEHRTAERCQNERPQLHPFANSNRRVLKDQQLHTEALTLARLDLGWFSGDPKTPRRKIRVVLPSLETLISMAWRLQDLVVEGEIDNTTKGIVTGWIQFSDRPDRVRLFLLGDCHPDLAGWRFKIKRRREVPSWAEPADSTPLAAEQSGHAGDITADQTIRDSDCPVEELLARMRAGEPPPHIMRKALYLEWYSSRNGRVVIQDTRLGVERLGERAFELTAEDLPREHGRKTNSALGDGYHVEVISFGPPAVLAQRRGDRGAVRPGGAGHLRRRAAGPVEEALRRLPQMDLFQSAEPFPGLKIDDQFPDLPVAPAAPQGSRAVRPAPAPPAAWQLTEQRARIELRKMELLLLPLNIRIEVCPPLRSQIRPRMGRVFRALGRRPRIARRRGGAESGGLPVIGQLRELSRGIGRPMAGAE